jgi:hypothetical protein
VTLRAAPSQLPECETQIYIKADSVHAGHSCSPSLFRRGLFSRTGFPLRFVQFDLREDSSAVGDLVAVNYYRY